MAYPRLISAHFWLVAAGIALYFVSLTIGGWLRGEAMLDASRPFMDSVAVTLPYLKARSVGGRLMVLATWWPAAHFIALALGIRAAARQPALLRQWFGKKVAAHEQRDQAAQRRDGDAGSRHQRAGGAAYLEVHDAPPLPGLKPMRRRAARRAVYIANGCVYCHSQQPRQGFAPDFASRLGARPRSRATTPTTSRSCWAPCAPGPI